MYTPSNIILATDANIPTKQSDLTSNKPKDAVIFTLPFVTLISSMVGYGLVYVVCPKDSKYIKTIPYIVEAAIGFGVPVTIYETTLKDHITFDKFLDISSVLTDVTTIFSGVAFTLPKIINFFSDNKYQQVNSQNLANASPETGFIFKVLSSVVYTSAVFFAAEKIYQLSLLVGGTKDYSNETLINHEEVIKNICTKNFLENTTPADFSTQAVLIPNKEPSLKDQAFIDSEDSEYDDLDYIGDEPYEEDYPDFNF